MYNLQEQVKTKIRVGYQLIDNPRFKVVKDNLPSRVDPSGYVDPNIKIQEAMKAGIRLEEYQRAIYDYNHQDDERELYRAEDEDYVNMDIYKSEIELLEEGYHSLEIYRKKMRNYYDDYLAKQAQEKMVQEPRPTVKTEEPMEREVLPTETKVS